MNDNIFLLLYPLILIAAGIFIDIVINNGNSIIRIIKAFKNK